MGTYERCHAPHPCFCMSCQLEDTKKQPSPPPDVVEAARRLEAWKNSANWNAHSYITDGTYDQDEDIETVCKWILNREQSHE